MVGNQTMARIPIQEVERTVQERAISMFWKDIEGRPRIFEEKVFIDCSTRSEAIDLLLRVVRGERTMRISVDLTSGFPGIVEWSAEGALRMAFENGRLGRLGDSGWTPTVPWAIKKLQPIRGGYLLFMQLRHIVADLPTLARVRRALSMPRMVLGGEFASLEATLYASRDSLENCLWTPIGGPQTILARQKRGSVSDLVWKRLVVRTGSFNAVAKLCSERSVDLTVAVVGALVCSLIRSGATARLNLSILFRSALFGGNSGLVDVGLSPLGSEPSWARAMDAVEEGVAAGARTLLGCAPLSKTVLEACELAEAGLSDQAPVYVSITEGAAAAIRDAHLCKPQGGATSVSTGLASAEDVDPISPVFLLDTDVEGNLVLEGRYGNGFNLADALDGWMEVLKRGEEALTGRSWRAQASSSTVLHRTQAGVSYWFDTSLLQELLESYDIRLLEWRPLVREAKVDSVSARQLSSGAWQAALEDIRKECLWGSPMVMPRFVSSRQSRETYVVSDRHANHVTTHDELAWIRPASQGFYRERRELALGIQDSWVLSYCASRETAVSL